MKRVLRVLVCSLFAWLLAPCLTHAAFTVTIPPTISTGQSFRVSINSGSQTISRIYFVNQGAAWSSDFPPGHVAEDLGVTISTYPVAHDYVAVYDYHRWELSAFPSSGVVEFDVTVAKPGRLVLKFDSPGASDVLIDVGNSTVGSITGHVTGPDGTTPLQNIEVDIYRWYGSYGDWYGYTYTDTNGQYQIIGLTTGTYRVQFYGNGAYFGECYSNAPDVNSAADIAVPAEGVVSNIDASLVSPSIITGTITGSDGVTPIEGVQATVFRWTSYYGGYWEWVNSSSADANGHYEIGGLHAGTYRVQFVDNSGTFAGECYSNAVFVDTGTDIVVPESTTVSNINASLALASHITGTITAGDGFTPLPNIGAEAYRWNGSYWSSVFYCYSDTNGQYEIGGLGAGTYRVQFYGDATHLAECYNNAFDLDSATDITVPAESTVSNINASLVTPSVITGTITGPDGVTPLQSVQPT